MTPLGPESRSARRSSPRSTATARMPARARASAADRGEARYTLPRRRMVEKLAGAGVSDPRVLDALGRLPRHRLVPEALRDSAYRSPDAFTGRGGISWLHRWALTAGRRPDFFAGEPATPDWVLTEAGIDSE